MKENTDEKKLKSVVLGLKGHPGPLGDAQKFFKYLKDEGADVEFMDCTEFMRFEPYVTYNNTHLSRFLAEKPDVEAVYCIIMDNEDRDIFLSWARELKLQTPNFIHPKTEIDPVVKEKLEARPNAGIYIFEDTKIGPDVKIGEFSVIGRKVCIAQDAKLEHGIFISSWANIGKGCTICEYAHVYGNVPDGATVAGKPAKILAFEDLAGGR